MHTHQQTFSVRTSGRGFFDIGPEVASVLRATRIHTGIVHIFAHHTSCSLLITENADPTVLADMERYFSRLVPDGDPVFEHVDEGPDDMSAHVRSALTNTFLTIPVTHGAPALGTWQGIFLWEHRLRPHQRTCTVTVLGI